MISQIIHFQKSQLVNLSLIHNAFLLDLIPRNHIYFEETSFAYVFRHITYSYLLKTKTPTQLWILSGPLDNINSVIPLPLSIAELFLIFFFIISNTISLCFKFNQGISEIQFALSNTFKQLFCDLLYKKIVAVLQRARAPCLSSEAL